VAAGGPEDGDGSAHRLVLGACVLVDVASVGDLALGSRVDAVDLAAGQVLELVDAQLLGQRVHARVLEELLARLVDGRQRGVLLQLPLARQFLGEVVTRIQVLQEAADGIELFGRKINLSRLENMVSDLLAQSSTKGSEWRGANLRSHRPRTRRKRRRRKGSGSIDPDVL